MQVQLAWTQHIRLRAESQIHQPLWIAQESLISLFRGFI
jgi:hypothetical protein